MNTMENERLLLQLQGELTGDRQQDRALLLQWADRYKGNTQAGPLLRQIGRMLFRLDEETTAAMTQEFLDEALARSDQAFAAAMELMEAERYDAAAEVLASAAEKMNELALPADFVWMDFHSFLDGLLFEDYFSEEINGREVRRHPLRPARLLRTYGEVLTQLERYPEAALILEGLIALDPVCPEDLCALANAYLYLDRTQDAWEALCWALLCASTREEAALCYLLLSLCRSQEEDWENAAVLAQKSLRVYRTREAEELLAHIEELAGQPAEYTDEDINRRCRELDVPTGRSKAVEENLAFLEKFSAEEE